MKIKGYNLTEVVVATAILLLLILIFFNVVILSQKYFKLVDVKAEVQLNVKLGMDKILKEAEQSEFNSFTVCASSVKAISFLSAYDSEGFYHTSSSGAPVWQKYIIFYVPSGENKLLRREIPSAGATAPLTESQLISYCNGTGTVGAFDISNFQLEKDNILKKVTIRLDTEKIYSGKENTSYLIGNLFF